MVEERREVKCPNGHVSASSGKPAKFCHVCGAAMRTQCSNGHDVRAGVKFCTTCGVPVGAASASASSTDTTADRGPNATGIDIEDDPAIGRVRRGGYLPSASFAEPTRTDPAPPVQSVPEVRQMPTGSIAGPSYTPGPPVLYAKPRRRTGLIVAIACVVAVIVIAAGVVSYALVGRSSGNNHAAASPNSGHQPNPSGTNNPSTTTTTVNPVGQQQAQALNGLLTQSASDRSQVVGATQQIATCTDVSQAIETLRSAASARQTLITRLGQQQTSQLPNSGQLVSTLTSAWQNSADSDSSYASWGTDELDRLNGCVPNDTVDASYVAAQTTDANASAAKQQFIGQWNPIATQYGLPQLTADQI